MPSLKFANLSPFLLLIALGGCVSVTEGEPQRVEADPIAMSESRIALGLGYMEQENMVRATGEDLSDVAQLEQRRAWCVVGSARVGHFHGCRHTATASVCRWHETRSGSPTSCGTSSPQISIASGHRGMNGHPGGTASKEGGRPGMPCSLRLPAVSGKLEIRRRV